MHTDLDTELKAREIVQILIQSKDRLPETVKEQKRMVVNVSVHDLINQMESLLADESFCFARGFKEGYSEGHFDGVREEYSEGHFDG